MGVESDLQAGTLFSIRYLPASAVAKGGAGEIGMGEIFLFTLQRQQWILRREINLVLATLIALRILLHEVVLNQIIFWPDFASQQTKRTKKLN